MLKFKGKVAVTALVAAAMGLGAPAQAKECRTGRTKIVGGEKATLKDWPGYAALRLRNADGARYLCGGSAISPEWVLTAAHCVDSETKQYIDAGDKLEVAIGVGDLGKVANKHLYGVKEIRLHPKYKDGDVVLTGHDIALIKLSRPFRGPFMPLSVKRRTDPDIGQHLRVAGFGNRKELPPGAPLTPFLEQSGGVASAGSELLQEATVSAFGAKKCREIAAYQEETDGPMIYPAIGKQQLCAAPDIAYDKRRGSCQGDSGGPLAAFKDGCPLQVGIVSWAYGCGNPKDPSIFTRISSYASWIRGVIGGEPETLESIDAPLIISAADQGLLQRQLRETLKGGEGRLKIRLPGGRTRFKLGEQTYFEVESQVSGKLYFFELGPSGVVTQIFPNSYVARASALSVKAGRKVRVPNGPHYGFNAFEAVEPPGDHVLLAIVIPEDAPLSGELGATFAPTKGLDDLPRAVKPFQRLVAEIEGHLGAAGGGDASGWGLSILRYEIVR